VTRFCHWPTGFRLLLSNSSEGGRNLAICARSRPFLARSWLAGWNPTVLVAEIWADRIPMKVAGIRFQWPNVVGFEHQTDYNGGRLHRLKDGQMRLSFRKNDLHTLLKGVNYFPKFTKHFFSNENNFTVDYYFCLHQTPKNTIIIFHKPFYAETNGT
jgi:hypothetical protein